MKGTCLWVIIYTGMDFNNKDTIHLKQSMSSLPMDLDCGHVIQPEDISAMIEEIKENDKLITTKSSKDVAINENGINIHSFDFIDCPKIVLLLISM